MKDIDIFSWLIQKELEKEDGSKAIKKYGSQFLSKLEIIGGQLEQILLNKEVEINEQSKLFIVTKEEEKQIDRALYITSLLDKTYEEARSTNCIPKVLSTSSKIKEN